MKTLGKYFLVDTGLRNIILAASASGLGHLPENIVCLELIRRGYKVNIEKLTEKEIDFVTSKTDRIEYYQVSASVLDESTLFRELEPLKKIPDNHPNTF